MYTPSHFAETRVEVLHDLIRRQPFATLVTLGPEGLDANHIPLLLSDEPGPHGALRGHVSRANPLWRNFDSNVDALAVFAGPQTYVTPSWYATKKETGQVVPTWNYVVVHARGPLRVIDDPVWLRAHIGELTQSREASLPEPWRVEDAPADYVSRLVGGIVGLEMTIRRIEGKWKVSQNHPEANRMGVALGLEKRGDDEALAVAKLVRERGAS